MRKRTFLNLLLTLVVATFMLFVTSQGWSQQQCTDNDLPFTCFFLHGYTVRVSTSPEPGGYIAYKYEFYKVSSTKLINIFDLLLPICNNQAMTPSSYSCSPACSNGVLKTGGTGDGSTGFGLGVTQYNTWNMTWNWPNATTYGWAKLIFPGSAVPYHSTIMAKAGSGGASPSDVLNYVYGEIQAPAFLDCITCKPPTAAAIVSTVFLEFGGVKYQINKDQVTDCIIEVYREDLVSGGWVKVDPIRMDRINVTLPDGTPEPAQTCGSFTGNERCPTCVIYAGTTSTRYFCSGGSCWPY